LLFDTSNEIGGDGIFQCFRRLSRSLSFAAINSNRRPHLGVSQTGSFYASYPFSLTSIASKMAIINQKNSNSHGGDIAAVLLLHFCPAAAAFCSCCAAFALLLPFCSCCCCILLLLMLLLHYYSAAAAAFRPGAAAATLCCCVLLLLQLRFANAAAVFCCCCSLLRGSNPMVVTGSLAWVGTNSHNCGLIISSIKTNSTKEISNHDQVTLDLGRLPQACYLGDSGKRDLRKKEVSIEELEYAQNALGEFGGNNRTGIAGTLHRISAIRNKNGRVVGLTCRLGRPVREIIDMTRICLSMFGRPGVGKTRVKGISHVLSYELLKRVAVKKPLVCCDKLKQATTSRAIINQKNSNSHGGDIAAVLLLHFCPAAAAAFCSAAAFAPAAAVLLLLLLHFASADAAAALLLCCRCCVSPCCCCSYALLLRFATAAAAFCYCCGCILLLLQFASWKQPHGSDGVLRIGSLHYSSSFFLHLNVTEMYLLLQSLAWEGTNSHNCGLIISSIKTNSTKEISNHDQVTLDLGRLPQACYLGDSGKRDLRKKEVSIEELEYAQNALGEFGGNNRTGIAGTLHRISAIRNKNGRVVGLTCRLGRPVREIIDMTRDLLEYGKSILFLGRWGCPPSKFPWTYTSKDTCYLLEGNVKVYPDGSDEAVQIAAGVTWLSSLRE
ncbi:UNVERIFIED_CONTAM: putative protein ycf45, partial [Sesamum angustifolium]